jgi:hypothetical protein
MQPLVVRENQNLAVVDFCSATSRRYREVTWSIFAPARIGMPSKRLYMSAYTCSMRLWETHSAIAATVSGLSLTKPRLALSA